MALGTRHVVSVLKQWRKEPRLSMEPGARRGSIPRSQQTSAMISSRKGLASSARFAPPASSLEPRERNGQCGRLEIRRTARKQGTGTCSNPQNSRLPAGNSAGTPTSARIANRAQHRSPAFSPLATRHLLAPSAVEGPRRSTRLEALSWTAGHSSVSEPSR